MQDTALREKLRKIEALFAGAATPGERDAAEAAMLRVRARLAEIQRRESPPPDSAAEGADIRPGWQGTVANAFPQEGADVSLLRRAARFEGGAHRRR